MASLFSLFGDNKKKSVKPKTVLLLDVENASVGAALVHLVPRKAPQLFAEKRIPLSIQSTLDTTQLAREIEKATHELLVHSRAARLLNENNEDGEPISHTAVFLGAPWSTPVWKQPQGRVQWLFEPHLQKSIAQLVQDSPTSFHPTGSAILQTIDSAFEHDDAFLLCSITGEVVEILYISGNEIIARATVPFGTHTTLRTLASHAGVSLHAARSALNLIDTSLGRQHPGPAWIHEPLSVAATHFAEHFTDAAKTLYANTTGRTAGAGSVDFARSVLVVAPEPLGELFASILGNATQASELFPYGGTVRALRPHHLVSHVSAEKRIPDLHLLAEAVFANKNF